MKNSFKTGGRYLLKVRRVMGCLSAPTCLGGLMLILASNDLHTLVFSLSITLMCGAALYKAITTRSDGTLTIDENGIWIEQTVDPTAMGGKRKPDRTHICWTDIEFVDVGYGHARKGHFAPNHSTVEANKTERKSRFMAHMSRTDWSIVIDHKGTRPAHLYAANMNEPVETGRAIGSALWNRNLVIPIEE